MKGSKKIIKELQLAIDSIDVNYPDHGFYRKVRKTAEKIVYLLDRDDQKFDPLINAMLKRFSEYEVKR